MSDFIPRFRGSFSDRNGIDKINDIIQLYDFDEMTRNNIINLIDEIVDNIVIKARKTENFYKYIYLKVFQVTKDEIPSFLSNSELRKPIYHGIKYLWTYDYVLSFIEGVLNWFNKNYNKYINILESRFNKVFETECVGYRFVNLVATRIINDEEIRTVNHALKSKYEACNKCISKSIELLYDREQPDYENSVKESISAVESICNIINGTKNKTLSEALKEIDQKNNKIHPALKKAFNNLYGYTSDKNGIRHNGGIDENTSFEEAQYMLVSCSAFLNYLIDLYEKKENNTE